MLLLELLKQSAAAVCTVMIGFVVVVVCRNLQLSAVHCNYLAHKDAERTWRLSNHVQFFSNGCIDDKIGKRFNVCVFFNSHAWKIGGRKSVLVLLSHMTRFFFGLFLFEKKWCSL